MKIMAGLIDPDEGRVVSNSAKVVYLPQIDEFNLDLSVEETVVRRLTEEYGDIEAKVRAARFISQVGFSETDQKVSELSGGWRKRLSLAISLAKDPDLLLLDEPSNHLDLAGLLWLEQLLSQAKFSWVMISHDRYLLERTASQICEVAPYYDDGVLKIKGSYSEFIEKRSELWQQQLSELALSLIHI